ncbi:hypothetical protein PMAYCL1PPCAC_02266 [Pristionchus mayeri]|uniref:Uncharacterized protein n=1 Tax=Pristionchus mayeri TaxID=1317129 RepID=A0AAN4Z1F8_9BILA|nr:hypothetical protein PMAYCL1PPCAC_02266 [Pristionchus mayeri]
MDVSEQQLCVRKFIRDNIACLRDTSPFVTRDCSRLCGSLSFLPGERTLSNSSMEEHKHCVFIHCHRTCQESLISRVCPSHSRRSAHEAVRSYYSSYQHEDLRIFVDENNDMPSSFCRRVSGYEENSESRSVHNRNLQILKGIKDRVKEMVESL